MGGTSNGVWTYQEDSGAKLVGQHVEAGNVSMVFRECLDNTIKKMSTPSNPLLQLPLRVYSVKPPVSSCEPVQSENSSLPGRLHGRQ